VNLFDQNVIIPHAIIAEKMMLRASINLGNFV